MEPNSLAEYLVNITLQQSQYLSEVNTLFSELEKNKVAICADEIIAENSIMNNSISMENNSKISNNNNDSIVVDSYALLCKYNYDISNNINLQNST